jgi:hypothetical protein
MYGFPIFTNGTTTMLVKLLEKIFDDKGEYISWWLWESVEKEIYYEDGEVRKVNTVEKLYDFLIDNIKEHETEKENGDKEDVNKYKNENINKDKTTKEDVNKNTVTLKEICSGYLK